MCDPLTWRQMWTRVWKHFITNRKCFSRKFGSGSCGCLLRIENSRTDVRRCSLGIFIPKKLYKPEFEGMSIEGLAEVLPFLMPKDLSARDGYEFLHMLQSCHDGSENKSQMKKALRDLRKEFLLCPPG